MKKLLVLMLCLSLLCVLVACGNAEKKTEAPSGSDAPSATVDPSETETSSTEAPSTEDPSTEDPSTEAPSTEAPSATVDPSETETSSTEAPTDGNEGWTGVAKDY